MAMAKSCTKASFRLISSHHGSTGEELLSTESLVAVQQSMQISREFMKRRSSDHHNNTNSAINCYNNGIMIMSSNNNNNNNCNNDSNIPAETEGSNLMHPAGTIIPYCTSAESSSCSHNYSQYNYSQYNYSSRCNGEQQKDQGLQQSINIAKLVERAKSNIRIKISNTDNSKDHLMIDGSQKSLNLQQQQNNNKRSEIKKRKKLHINGGDIQLCSFNGGSPNPSCCTCSMCGDEGIVELLALCIRCSHRYQHTYCSRSYPNVGTDKLTCNWCLHEEAQLSSAGTKESDTTISAADYPIGATNNQISAIDNQSGANNRLITAIDNRIGTTNSKISSTDHRISANNCQISATDDRIGRTGSIDNRIGATSSKISSIEHRIGASNSQISTVDRRIAPNNSQISAIKKQQKGSADQIGANKQEQRGNGDQIVASKQEQTGNRPGHQIVTIKRHGPRGDQSSGNGESASSEKTKHSKAFEYLLMIAESCPGQVQAGAAEIKEVISEANEGLRRANNSRINGGILSFGHVPKRQRCSKGSISASKCRKKGLQLSPPRPNFKRYKLLADVLC